MTRKRLVAVLAAAGVVAAILLVLLLTSVLPTSIWTVVLLCFTLGAVVISAAGLASRDVSSPSEFSHLAQGLAGLVTIIALFIAAGLYFLERKDKARLSFHVDASVVRTSATPQGPPELMLAVSVPVENKGAGRLEVQCIAIDIAVHPVGEAMPRNPDSSEEIRLAPLRRRLAITHPSAQACVRSEAARRGVAADSIRPLFMWRPLVLEPGDVDDLHFEIPLDCESDLVRVLVKMRIRPSDRFSYETKTIVPLSDTCSGAVESRRALSSPVVEADFSGSDASEAEPEAEAEAEAEAQTRTQNLVQATPGSPD